MHQLNLSIPGPLAARDVLFLSTAGQPFTTSRAVAERFGKRHKNVLRGITKLLATDLNPELNEPNFGLSEAEELALAEAGFGTSDDDVRAFTELNFEPSEYTDPTGRRLPEYRLTRDGFHFIVSGFTGPKATRWKIAFIKTFNAMEAELAAKTERRAAALCLLRPDTVATAEATERGYNRNEIGLLLGKSPSAVTYHRRRARQLGLLNVA